MVLIMKMHSYLINNNEVGQEKETTAKKPENSNLEDVRIEHDYNLSFINYIYFLLFPSLVYQVSYPRTKFIRWSFILEKCILCLGVFSSLHLISQFYILPLLQKNPY